MARAKAPPKPAPTPTATVFNLFPALEVAAGGRGEEEGRSVETPSMLHPLTFEAPSRAVVVGPVGDAVGGMVEEDAMSEEVQ